MKDHTTIVVGLHKAATRSKDFRHEREARRYFFTSARIVGRAIEYVPSRLIDAFPRRRVGALSIDVALASTAAVSRSFLVSSFAVESHARAALARRQFITSFFRGRRVVVVVVAASQKDFTRAKSPAAPRRHHHRPYLLRGRNALVSRGKLMFPFPCDDLLPSRRSTLYNTQRFITAALCNRAGHYIYALWFLYSFFLFFSSPNLSGRRSDVYHTSTHGVALARI